MSEYTLYPLSSAPRVPFKLDGRILYTSDNYELVHLTLQPGEGMEMHTQPMDVVFFVIEGTGILAIGDEVVEVTENMTVHVSRGMSRAWSNHGDAALRLLVNKIQ
jgi:mannose-6-phosphate isomerase-like protein (cupin superfamily)